MITPISGHHSDKEIVWYSYCARLNHLGIPKNITRKYLIRDAMLLGTVIWKVETMVTS